MGRRRRYSSKRRRISNISGIIFILAVLALAYINISKTVVNSDTLEVTFIDVGQGDAAFIRTPSNASVLLDGGGSVVMDSKTGEHVLLPFMTNQGVFEIDKAIVSHYHDDHGGGVVEVLNGIKVDGLYMPDTKTRPKLHDRLVEAAGDTDIYYIKRGDNVTVDEDTWFDTLFPDPALFDNKKDNLNNDSLIMKLIYGEVSFLFTGDLEADAERVIPSEELKSDVLKVGHHGSKTSTSQEFLDGVLPIYAVIGVGANNTYGHPRQEVLDRLMQAKVETYLTSKSGSITFYADKERIITIKTTSY